MTNQMRQRLIGLLVIIAILAIFVPILFHNPNSHANKQLSIKMPAPPAAPDVEMQVAGQPVVTTPANVASATPVKPATEVAPQEATPQVAAPQKAALSAESSVVSKAPVQPHAATIVPKTAAKTPRPQHASPVANKRYTLKNALAPPQAWSVQIASFNDAKHAVALISQLRKGGFEAYYRSHREHGKLVVRVFVGPEIEYKNAELLHKRIKTRYHLDGLIVKYHV